MSQRLVAVLNRQASGLVVCGEKLAGFAVAGLCAMCVRTVLIEN